MRQIKHFINGVSCGNITPPTPAPKHHAPDITETVTADVFDPNRGTVQAKLALGSTNEVNAAVAAAQAAQPAWSKLNPQRRARVMFAFKQRLEAEIDSLANDLSAEHGKTIADAKGDIQRGLEVIEFACNIPHLLKGEYSHSAGTDIDVYSMREPLGVVAGITPFNFPAMIPMWMFGIAIACGNAFILKPSERTPTVPTRLGGLMCEAGLPNGVLNIVHGDKRATDAILAHPQIQAVSFVGSSDVAHYVYQTASKNGKRVQAMGGAKNHGVIMPDADIHRAASEIAGAAYGSAGERCMALSVAVPVGEKTAEKFIDAIKGEIKNLNVGESTNQNTHFGPVVTKQHRNKIKNYIRMGIDEGAKLIVDGRKFKLKGYEKGFFIGPSLFDHVRPEMKSYQQEIFGPVLQIIRAENFEQACQLPSQHQYGNGAAIFTRSGTVARAFTDKVNVGMIGINVPIPVPIAYHTFGGWKRSAFGDVNQHGTEGVRFYTKIKTCTARWETANIQTENDDDKSVFVIPTL